MNKITIILPSYNHAKFLKDRLESISNQTYKNWEMIIIDDKSSDNSLEILTDFVNQNKEKIKYFIVNKENSGSGYNSWEKGIELAQTEYVWIAETDDYSRLSFLEEQIKILEENKQASLSFCASKYVDTNKRFLYTTDRRTQDLKVSENEYKVFNGKVFIDQIPFNTYITNGSSVIFRKPKSQLPEYIFKHKQTSDIFLWTFLLQNTSFIFLNKKLNYFRRHENSTTTMLSSFKQKDIYKEKLKLINFYQLKNRNKQFINHYFNHYIWNNKKEIFNTKIFNSFDLKLKYYLRLIPNIFYKFLKKYNEKAPTS